MKVQKSNLEESLSKKSIELLYLEILKDMAETLKKINTTK